MLQAKVRTVAVFDEISIDGHSVIIKCCFHRSFDLKLLSHSLTVHSLKLLFASSLSSRFECLLVKCRVLDKHELLDDFDYWVGTHQLPINECLHFAVSLFLPEVGSALAEFSFDGLRSRFVVVCCRENFVRRVNVSLSGRLAVAALRSLLHFLNVELLGLKRARLLLLYMKVGRRYVVASHRLTLGWENCLRLHTGCHAEQTGRPVAEFFGWRSTLRVLFVFEEDDELLVNELGFVISLKVRVLV